MLVLRREHRSVLRHHDIGRDPAHRAAGESKLSRRDRRRRRFRRRRGRGGFRWRRRRGLRARRVFRHRDPRQTETRRVRDRAGGDAPEHRPGAPGDVGGLGGHAIGRRRGRRPAGDGGRRRDGERKSRPGASRVSPVPGVGRPEDGQVPPRFDGRMRAVGHSRDAVVVVRGNHVSVRAKGRARARGRRRPGRRRNARGILLDRAGRAASRPRRVPGSRAPRPAQRDGARVGGVARCGLAVHTAATSQTKGHSAQRLSFRRRRRFLRRVRFRRRRARRGDFEDGRGGAGRPRRRAVRARGGVRVRNG